MAANDVDPTTGAKIYLGTGAPDTGADLTELAADAARTGTRLIGSTAERTAYAYGRQGLLWYDTDAGREYRHDGSSWVRKPISFSGSVGVAPSAPNTATPQAIVFPAGMFPSAPDVVAGVSSPNASVGVSNVTAAGFTATIIRNTTTSTVVTWFANLN